MVENVNTTLYPELRQVLQIRACTHFRILQNTTSCGLPVLRCRVTLFFVSRDMSRFFSVTSFFFSVTCHTFWRECSCS